VSTKSIIKGKGKEMDKRIDKRNLEKAREYKSKGLGVREIARLLKKDPTQILRWLRYDVDTFPQKNKEKVLTHK
jgi:hypothetical protein